MFKSLTSSLLIINQFAEATFKCPRINCDTTFGEMNCYSHSGDNPVESITTFSCPEDRVCDLVEDKFAWVTSRK